MNEKKRSLLEIHTAVILFGLSGLFGKLILLPAMIIALGRVVFSSIFLFLALRTLKIDVRLQQRREYGVLSLMGVILAIHWSTFFLSIQVSTVAVGLLTFSTFPVFVTFLEPYFFKERLQRTDLVVALVSFGGVLLILPGFSFDNTTTQGVLWGILSGFTYGILSLLNRKYVKEYSSLVIAFYEQLAAAVVLIPFFFCLTFGLQLQDVLLLGVLGIVFTGIAHSLFIRSLKNIKAQTAGIISCLEPLYGILFAACLLNEMPGGREIIGGIIILCAVIYSNYKMKKDSAISP